MLSNILIDVGAGLAAAFIAFLFLQRAFRARLAAREEQALAETAPATAGSHPSGLRERETRDREAFEKNLSATRREVEERSGAKERTRSTSSSFFSRRAVPGAHRAVDLGGQDED